MSCGLERNGEEVARYKESHAKNIHMHRIRMMKRYATKQENIRRTSGIRE